MPHILWTVSVGSVDTSKMRALQRPRALHDAKEPFIVLAQTNHTVELLNSELQSSMNPPSPNKREVFAFSTTIRAEGFGARMT